MKEGKVQRLPVIAKNGTLAGVISMDDLLLRAELTSLGRQPEISTDEVVSLFSGQAMSPLSDDVFFNLLSRRGVVA